MAQSKKAPVRLELILIVAIVAVSAILISVGLNKSHTLPFSEAQATRPEEVITGYLLAGKPVLIMFTSYSGSCVACRQMDEVVRQVYPDFKDTVPLVYVDTDNKSNSHLFDLFGVVLPPVQVFLSAGGTAKETVFGYMLPSEFRANLEAIAREQ